MIAFGVLVIGAAVLAMIRKDDPFQSAANDLGLKLSRTVPELLPNLDGLVDGIAVKIDVATGREPAVRYEIFYPPLGLALNLERETTITRTLGQLGASDPQIGSKPFDDSFRVSTSRPDALQTMMNPQRRRLLVKLIETYPNVKIQDGSILLISATLDPPAETVVTTTRDLVAAASSLIEGRPAPLPEPEPQRVVPPAQASPPTASERTTAAAPASSPGSPSSKAATPPPPPPPPPPEPEPADVGLPIGFFDDVFGANRLSFEDQGTFDTEIRGTAVTLTGTVKQASPYKGDEELTAKAGTKAVVTVAQIDNDLYGKTDIDAVVYLPGAKADTFDRGDTISFVGNIEKVDPFMRNLFVVDAKTTS